MRSSSTSPPSATPTPHPSPDGTAVAFLAGWTAADYDTMYELLTEANRLSLSREQFLASYLNALDEATATVVRAELRSLLHDGPRALAGFRAEWQTILFGLLEFDYTLRLAWEGERWHVDWTPGLVLPQLRGGLRLVLLDRVPVRGNIYDRAGLELAVNEQRITIGVVPAWMDDEAFVVAQLSAITGMDVTAIHSAITSAQPDWFVPIAEVTPEVSLDNSQVLASLAGVVHQERPMRVYRGDALAGHVLGYLGAIPVDDIAAWQARGYRGDESVGRAGIEGWAESHLAGRRGGRLVVLDQSNQELAQVAEAAPRPSSDVYLTIDRTLQAEAERILGERPGAIVALDPNNGFVLALASYPHFDPALFAAGLDSQAWNAINSDPYRPLVNRASQGIYPPGSVFKIVAIAAALEHLGLAADAPFSCTGTWDRLGVQFIKFCWLKTGHGNINLHEGLTQSCNSVFYDVGLALHNLDPGLLPVMARAFGLGAVTGITVIEEGAGMVPDPAWKLTEKGETWYPGDTVNLAIGQSYLLVTPLQIVNMLAAVGNGGTLYRPQLVRRIARPTGPDEVTQPETAGRLPVSPEHLSVIRSALEGVVNRPYGTARAAFEGASFTAAGKTGTAETGQEQPHSWFAGYAPADIPQIAIAVILEHAGEGSQAAAPAFRQVVEAYLIAG